MNDILEKIRLMRADMELGQREMAEKLNMTQNNYSRLERGEISITLDRLTEIANIFEIPVSSFFREDYEEEYQKLMTQLDGLKSYIRKMAMKGKGVVDIDFDIDTINLDFAELKERVNPSYYEEYDQLFEEINEKAWEKIEKDNNDVDKK